MTSKIAALKTINEGIASKVRLVSVLDREELSEGLERSQKRLSYIIASLAETRIDEESITRLNDEMLKEAIKLERLVILEGAADKNFFEIQKNFRSMVRAANVLVKWFPGSAMSSKMEQLRTEGIELLSDLYDHIKNLEDGVNTGNAGLKLNKEMAQQRDRFMKVFADFAIVFRGMMSVADLFSEDPTSVGGYNDVQDVFASLESDFKLTDEPLGQAFQVYDESSGMRNKLGSGPSGLPGEKSYLGKLFGSPGRKKPSIEAKFDRGVVQAIQSKTPGFNKIVPIQDVLQALKARSLDTLRAYFDQFNSFVASDVDVNFLLQVSQNPRTIGNLFKGVFNALSQGTMKTMNR